MWGMEWLTQTSLIPAHGQEGRHRQPAPLLTVKGRTDFSRLFPSCTSPQPPVLPDTNQKTLSETFQLQR